MLGKDKIVIRKTESFDLIFIKDNLREIDIEEIRAMHGDISVSEIVFNSYVVSRKCWTLLRNNKPVFVFGVADSIDNKKIGDVWLLGTDEMEKIKIKILKISKPYINEMLKGYSMIQNYVAIKNRISIKWLKWCGFFFEKGTKTFLTDSFFIRFWMEANHV
jgi:hypothetical protein